MNRTNQLQQEHMIETFLTRLGFSKEESTIFSILIKNGPSTVLTLSRESKINRTRIYRTLEQMVDSGIVSQIIEEHRRFFKAAELAQLERMVRMKEEETKELSRLFPKIASLIPEVSSLTQPSTKVVFYRGTKGIQQQGWNTLSAHKEILGYTYRIYAEIVGQKFADEWATELINRRLRFREILSDAFYQSTKEKPHLKGVGHIAKSLDQTRYISPQILDIQIQMDIYDGVISIYNWYEGEVFGVEIYNDKVAAMQKQLFEMAWKMAKPV